MEPKFHEIALPLARSRSVGAKVAEVRGVCGLKIISACNACKKLVNDVKQGADQEDGGRPFCTQSGLTFSSVSKK